MKTKFLYILTLITIFTTLNISCNKDEQKPLTPTSTEETEDDTNDEIPNSGLTPNITISDIKSLYSSLETVDGTIKTFNMDLVLEAKVISTDKYDNFYKEIYVEDASGALVLLIDNIDLYKDYSIGQTVHIKLNGLNINYDLNFKAIIEIGFGVYDDGYSVKLGRIPASLYKDLILKDGKPSTPSITTIALNENSISDANVGKLIKIENTQFVDSDTNSTFADAVNLMSRNLTLESCTSDNQLTLRTSGYSSFAGINVHTGNGNITGILTKYGSLGYQFIINSNNDVVFNNTRCEGGSDINTGTGSGTFDDPYDVDAGIANNNIATSVWVKGYIVGVLETGGIDYYSSLTNPFYTPYNLYLAKTATESDTTKMLIIQLTAGEIRDVTNLVDNSNLVGSNIMYRGDLLTYNTLPGMRNTDGYWLNGAGIDPDYVDPNAIWAVNFTNGLNPFTTVNLEGTQTWNSDSQYGALISGYDNGSYYTNEDWLISNPIDLSGKTGVKFNLNQAVNYLDTWDNIKIYATDNYSGDVTTTTWTEIIVNTKPTGNDWNFVQSEDVDFSAFDNKPNVVIAFKYVSSASAGATWKIKTVTLKQ